ncbi:MAG TPA: DUF5615 family PIN-like protein [Pyrinomonadaceae bacterium]|nr:DUF5615 family PIN-like protein [Pyrinomonadaceae bacterium]
MNLLADESVDRQIVKRLRQDGHGVTYVAEWSPVFLTRQYSRERMSKKPYCSL